MSVNFSFKRVPSVSGICRIVLAAIAIAPASMLPSYAQRNESQAYYGVFSAGGSPDVNPRITEIITTYYSRMSLDRPAGSIVFVPDNSVVTTYFGPYETVTDARKAAFWYDDPEWMAALTAAVGDADRAKAIVDEHLSLSIEPESYVVSLRMSDGADFSAAPFGPGADTTPAFYVQRTTTYTDEGRERALEIVDDYFAPAQEAAGTEFLEFTGVDTQWDVKVLFGRYDSPEAAGAAMQPDGATTRAFLAALAQIAGSEERAAAINEEFAGLVANDEFVVVGRPIAAGQTSTSD